MKLFSPSMKIPPLQKNFSCIFLKKSGLKKFLIFRQKNFSYISSPKIKKFQEATFQAPKKKQSEKFSYILSNTVFPHFGMTTDQFV